MSGTTSCSIFCMHTQKNKRKFYWPFHSSHTWLWSCGTTPGSTHRLDCNKAHLVSLDKTVLVALISSHFSAKVYTVFSIPPPSLTIIFCLHVPVKPPNWRHEVCNLKHSSTSDPISCQCSPSSFLFSFCVFCLS